MTPSNVTSSFTRLAALAAFVFVFGLIACDTSAAQEQELDPGPLSKSAATLAAELDLSAEQARAVDDLFRPTGHLWTVAAGLQQRLTDEQKARLLERAEQRRARFAEEGWSGRRFHQKGRHGRPGPARGFRRGLRGGSPGTLGGLLTPEQQEQFKTLREEHRAGIRALMQARRDSMKEDIDALLTDEQKATLEERRASRQEAWSNRREQATQTRNEALGLTAEQETAWKALREEHRDERNALIEQVRAGDLDRTAMRAQMQEMRETHRTELATILTSEQMEIVEIHDALLGEIGHRSGWRPGRRHGRGLGPRGPYGPGGPHRR